MALCESCRRTDKDVTLTRVPCGCVHCAAGKTNPAEQPYMLICDGCRDE